MKNRYFPFGYKLMLSYLLVVFVTVAAIGSISYTVMVQSRTEMAETNIRTAMALTSSNIQYRLEEITRMSDTLFSSIPFQRALQKTGDPMDIYLLMMDEIVPQIREPLQLFGNNLRIMLYTMNENLYVVQGDDPLTPIEKSDYYILPFDSVRNEPWMRELRERGLDNRWMQVDYDRELSNISHVRRLVSFTDYQTVIGYLRITVSLEQLIGDAAGFPEEEGFVFRMFDAETGESLYQLGKAKDREAGGSGDGRGGENGRGDDPTAESRDERAQSVDLSALRLTEPIPDTSYVLEMTVPGSYLNRDAANLRWMIFSVGLISFLLMSLIGFAVARLSDRKMRRIITLIGAFQEGHFTKRIHFSGNDEFARIGRAFNRMAADIQNLINRVYVQDIQKKQAELEALQAQINPHFLYNTLSTVSSLANMGEIDKVTEMVHGLSRFYRLTLNRGEVMITLQNELDQVRTYLDIQRVKYADRFQVYVDVEPELLGHRVIKLILQPFVENVFKHAWFGDTIAIRITGRRAGDAIVLKVIDNGIGMRRETVERLMRRMDDPNGAGDAGTSGGYGLKNVDERIRLRHGEGYGVTLHSIYGGGTTVTIRLPLDGQAGQEERDEEVVWRHERVQSFAGG